MIGGGAARGEFFAARRLRELPDGGVRDAAGGWGWRIVRDDATGCGRASVVVDKVGEVALAEVVANVVGSDDGHAVAFADGHSGAIDSCAITGARECIDPGAQVGVILGGQAATLLDIQKNNRVGRKSFFF